jgi:hypothetical protein
VIEPLPQTRKGWLTLASRQAGATATSGYRNSQQVSFSPKVFPNTENPALLLPKFVSPNSVVNYYWQNS